MSNTGRSLLLTDLSWMEVRAHLDQDRRLIVPIGACDQYGPHLPIGSGTLVVEAVADALARAQGVLRAPAMPYGVNIAAERRFAGAASLREKTLHRLVNDILSCWEDDGFTEFIVLTAQSYDPHVEAIATVAGTTARVRVIDILDIDFSDLLQAERFPQHAGEMMTSLLLYLAPDLVKMDRAEDYPPERLPQKQVRVTKLPALSVGVVGYASIASAEVGRAIFERIVDKVGTHLFEAVSDPASTASP